MHVAVIGSRTYRDRESLFRDLDRAWTKWGPFTLVSGGAAGADRLAEEWATKRGVPALIFRADWERYGRKAGPLRNRAIVLAADAVIAYWDGRSPGTRGTLEMAQAAGLPIFTR